MTQQQQNLSISILLVGGAIYCATLGKNDVALALIGTIAALWRHSGRDKGEGGGLMPAGLVCLVSLAFGCGEQVGLVNLRDRGQLVRDFSGAPGIQAKLIVDSIEFSAAAAPSYTSGRGGIHLLNTDGVFYTQDANGLLIKLHAAQSYRTSTNCSGLASPANGDVCYDTTIPGFRYYSAGWTTAPVDDSLLLHKAGTETITGVKTFSAAPVFGAGLTASGAVSNNFSGSTGAFLTSTGANTFGGSSNAFTNAVSLNGTVTAGDAAADVVTVKGTLRVDNTANTFYVTLTHSATANRAVTLPDAAGAVCIDSATQTLSNKTLTSPVINGATSGSGNFDLSGSSGTTKTTTGAVTIGPGAVGVSGDVTLTTTKTLAAGANTLISGDKLQASMLAIGSQATGDLLYASSGTAWARLAVGSTGQVPTVSGGVPAWANPVHAVITGGARGTLGAATGYLSAPGVAWSTTTEPVLMVATRTATVRSLYCDLGTAPGGADTVILTVRKNAADQATTCTITGAGTTCNDTSNTFAVSAGNRLTVKGVSSAGVAADLHCSVEVGN